MEGGFDGGLDAFGFGHFDEAVVDGDDGDAGFQQGGDIDKAIDAFFFAALPAAAVDDKGDRSGGGGVSFPEVEDVAFVSAVGDGGGGGFGNGGGVSGRGFGLILGVGGSRGGEECQEEQGFHHAMRDETWAGGESFAGGAKMMLA